MTICDLDRPDYTGAHSTKVHSLAVDPIATRHLHAEISVIHPPTLRTLCGEWAGIIHPIPATTVGELLAPRVTIGARLCLDCLSMAAAEHEVMHQAATRPARVLAAALSLLARPGAVDGDNGHA